MINERQLDRAVTDLGLAGRPVMVHASLRSFGERVEADGLLEVFRARGCTVLVPAFTEPRFGMAAPEWARPPRNGIDYVSPPEPYAAADAPVYRVDHGLVNPRLGALPAALVRRADAARGDHPLNSFASIGPLAEHLAAAQHPGDVYGPIRALADLGGAVLLVGVDLRSMTALHLAEQLAGRRLFVRWARDAHGRISPFEVGSCSQGFLRLGGVLAPYGRRTAVGKSSWRAYSARDAVAAAAAAIAADQEITRCSDADCLLCRDAIAGGPVLPDGAVKGTAFGATGS
ncbi:AAC(3) family N-acetyltransferase [Actinosynnema sp. NPDC091369]